jgi:hypothetical protein
MQYGPGNPGLSVFFGLAYINEYGLAIIQPLGGRLNIDLLGVHAQLPYNW